MKMRFGTGICLGRVVVVGLVLAVTSSICVAEEYKRQGKGEVFFIGQSLGSDTTTGLGITMELDPGLMGGFGVGINLSDNFNVNTALQFGNSDFNADTGVSVDLKTLAWDFNLDFNILKARLTPMVSGGIGFIRFTREDNLIDESDFSYNAGAGLRWDITEHLMVKAMYRVMWVKMQDTDSRMMLDGPSISVGLIF